MRKKVEEIRKTQQPVASEESKVDLLGLSDLTDGLFLDFEVINRPPYPLTWRWNTYNIFNSEHNVSVDDSGNMSWNHNSPLPSGGMGSAAGVGVFFSSSIDGTLIITPPPIRITYEYQVSSPNPLLSTGSNGWVGYYIGAVVPGGQKVGSTQQSVWNAFYSSSSKTTRDVGVSSTSVRISRGTSYSLWMGCGGNVESSMGYGGLSSADGSMSLNIGTIQFEVGF
ncbi:hypothetical protein [Bacillus mycoides]|uniref:hypothetical protein n=1 Tax=Bacillus mycoides TaxID=1405 RepID=UPI00355738AC